MVWTCLQWSDCDPEMSSSARTAEYGFPPDFHQWLNRCWVGRGEDREREGEKDGGIQMETRISRTGCSTVEHFPFLWCQLEERMVTMYDDTPSVFQRPYGWWFGRKPGSYHQSHFKCPPVWRQSWPSGEAVTKIWWSTLIPWPEQTIYDADFFRSSGKSCLTF